jgi:hypothetical protein
MNKQLAIASALFAVAGALPAQSRGTVTDFRMITEVNDGAPDTAVIHSISSGKKHRMEFTGALFGPLNPFAGGSGNVQLMTLADSEWTLDYLDTNKKTYFEFRVFEMMKATKQMMKDLGGEGMDVGVKLTTTADTTTVDSLGDGGVVMGYSTLHFRSYSAHYWTMSVMGQSTTMSLRQIVDSYVSPALKSKLGNLDSTSFGPEALKSMMAMLSAMMPTGMDSVMAKSATKLARINSVGMPVRTAINSTTVMMGVTKHEKQTMEILKIEKTTVPDSVFRIPADFTKVDSPLQFPPMPSGTSKTSQSLRTPF